MAVEIFMVNSNKSYCYYVEQETRPVEEPVTARKVGEVVSSTFGVLASALDYPLGRYCNTYFSIQTLFLNRLHSS